MVNIRQNLVDASKYNIKCPYEIKPEGITIHNTANKASAENEIAYMRRNDKQTSFHYAVDDKEIVQGLPENRNGWHAGDSHGPGNMTTIAIEICYSTGDKTKFEKAQKNAAELVAMKMKEYGWEMDKIYTHEHWSGKHCPHRTLDEYGWDYFIDLVKSFLMPPKAEQKPMYSVRKTWEDEKNQKGAYEDLESAKKCCDMAGKDYEVYNDKGVAVYPEKNETVELPEATRPFELGDAVKVVKGAVWNTGKAVPSWVLSSKMYVRGYKSDDIVTISTLKSGAVTGSLDIKYITSFAAATTSSSFKSYIVKITADKLNVRAGAGSKYKVNTVVKKNELYTIVDEKDGWGKLKSGAGWISLNYTKKMVK